jgi:hypothetical protein
MPTDNLIPGDEPAKRSQMELVARSVFARAADLVVTDDASYAAGAELLNDIVAKRKEVDATRLSITRPMDEAKARVMDLFRPISDVIARAERDVRGQMADYAEAVERERARERARLEAEAAAEREKTLAEAEALRRAGRVEMAEELEYEAETTPTPTVAGSSPKGTRKVLTAEVFDLKELARFAVASGRVEELLLPNESTIKALIKANVKIPGVRAVAKTSIVAGR